MRSTRAVVLPKGLLDVDQCSFGELAGGSTVNLRTPAASGQTAIQLMAAVLAPHRPNLSQCPRPTFALSCPMDNEWLFRVIIIVGGLSPIAVVVLFLVL